MSVAKREQHDYTAHQHHAAHPDESQPFPLQPPETAATRGGVKQACHHVGIIFSDLIGRKHQPLANVAIDSGFAFRIHHAIIDGFPITGIQCEFQRRSLCRA